MNILDEIVASKKKEVMEAKALRPTKLLEQSIHFEAPTVSLRKYLLREDKEGVIAEIKRKSPSKGSFHKTLSVEKLSIGYMQAGATALSILTDHKFFGGSLEDLRTARLYNFCPILRKDFIVDEYQLVEARSAGADAVLLIASCLSQTEIRKLCTCAFALQLEVLLEVHSLQELQASYIPEITMIGVNNRDLRDFSVDIQRALSLAETIPTGVVKVAESGISSVEDVKLLRDHGYQGFLIGERFMSRDEPELACARFLQEIRNARSL
jgi:indole-3-glycerol phosphate synthase